MATAWIGVGSNLGDRMRNLERAAKLIGELPGIKIVAQSAIYETLPQGGPPQGHFLNAVWKLETSLSPEDLLKVLRSIEVRLGRKRRQVNEPRTIDLDILDYDGRVEEGTELILPHPRLHEREFVLRPLYSLAPDWIHPKLGKTVGDLWMECIVCHSRGSGNPVAL